MSDDEPDFSRRDAEYVGRFMPLLRIATRYYNLIWEAEALSREGKLMTLPATEPVQLLRDWMEGEFLAQIEDGAEPLSYPRWLAGARQEVRLTGPPPAWGQ